MGIWEMRNPYYVEQVMQKILEYNYNSELRVIMRGDEVVSPQERLVKEQFPEFRTKLQEVIEWEIEEPYNS